MIDNNVYLDDFSMAIAENAWDAYLAFRGEELRDWDAQQQIKELHFAHVRKMLELDLVGADGTVIVTDIPNDLALVDAHFPFLNQRQVTLMTRTGADFVVGVLARRGHRVPLVQ